MDFTEINNLRKRIADSRIRELPNANTTIFSHLPERIIQKEGVYSAILRIIKKTGRISAVDLICVTEFYEDPAEAIKLIAMYLPENITQYNGAFDSRQFYNNQREAYAARNERKGRLSCLEASIDGHFEQFRIRGILHKRNNLVYDEGGVTDNAAKIYEDH